MRGRSAVSAEPLWIALRSDCLSVQMAAAARDSKIHSSAVAMAAFSSSFDEVIAAEVIETESIGALWASSTGKWLDAACAANRQLHLFSRWRQGAAKIGLEAAVVPSRRPTPLCA